MSISSLQTTGITPNQALGHDSQNNIDSVSSEGTEKSSSNKAGQKKSIFENFLSRSNKNIKPTNDVLSNKLADIKRKGSLVINHPLPNIVKDYVKEVKSFITDVKDHAFKHQLNDEKVFEKMELVDKKLAELGDKLLEDNKDELAVVAKLGELQGLIIDFYV